jgi:hypothetical protein
MLEITHPFSIPTLSSVAEMHHPTIWLRGGASAVLASSKEAVSLPPSHGSSDSLLTPEGKAVVFMAIAMSFHYLGYSLARSITLSLFGSETTGYKGSTAAFPFAMAFVSPLSLAILMGYANILEMFGPRDALMQSTLFCALVMSAAGVAISTCLRFNWKVFGSNIPVVKCITGPLLVFRESYVQLLTSQYWSFMASALTPNQSAKWFGPIAGLTSISSVIAGVAVSPLVKKIGLSVALVGTGIMLLVSMWFSNIAYGIARAHDFEPSDRTHNKKKSPAVSKNNAAEGDLSNKNMGLIAKAARLFQRVPVLRSLFIEILASQGLATILNVCFVDTLGNSIPNDDERAGWLGKYYALINLITMALQFAILPPLMSICEPKTLWRVIPLLSLCFTLIQALEKNPSLRLVGASLLVMKVSEYSARRTLDEMIFVPLDFESRFLGKEVIGVFGYRFGKSLMSLALSVIGSLDPTWDVHKQSILSAIVAGTWLQSAWKLSNLVPTRAEAQAAYQNEHAKKNHAKKSSTTASASKKK